MIEQIEVVISKNVVPLRLLKIFKKMKKILSELILTFVLSMVCLVANAQKITGSFAPLAKEARVKMNVDFSQALIMGMSEEEFTVFEEDWTHDKVEILSLFYDNANDVLDGSPVIGNYKQDTEFTLNLVVRTVDARGNYDCDLFLVRNLADGSQEEIAKAEGVYARGGKIGTKLNLMKDGAKHTGKELGKFLKKAAKNR